MLLDPRRVQWDESWAQEAGEPQFRTQVQWELSGIRSADVVLVHLEAGTRSPVTLLELELVLGRESAVVVSCEEGFWRRGNVVITCEQAGVAVHTQPSAAVAEVRALLVAAGG